MSASQPAKKNDIPQRASVSADASRAAELQRVKEMSIEERVREALEMKQHFTWLKPTPRES